MSPVGESALVLLLAVSLVLLLRKIVQCRQSRKLLQYMTMRYLASDLQLWLETFSHDYHCLAPAVELKELRWNCSEVHLFYPDNVVFQKRDDFPGHFMNWDLDRRTWYVKSLVYEQIGPHLRPVQQHYSKGA